MLPGIHLKENKCCKIFVLAHSQFINSPTFWQIKLVGDSHGYFWTRDAKLTNSGGISHGYEYSQQRLDRFLPKEAVIKCYLFRVHVCPRIEHWKRKMCTLCITRWGCSHCSDSQMLLVPRTCMAHQEQQSLSYLPAWPLQPFSKVGAASRLHLIYI